MGTLIGNGSNLYRRSSQLVRTPIKITLTDDEQCYYAVAGSYDSSAFPLHGFTGSKSPGGCRSAIANLFDSYTNPTLANQHWRMVETGADSQFLFHSGRYAPSYSTDVLQTGRAEAFINLCGYHFTLPQSLSRLAVTGITLKFHLGGTLMSNGDPRQSAAARRRFAQLEGKRGLQGVAYNWPEDITYGGTTYEAPVEYRITHAFSDVSFPVKITSYAGHPYTNDLKYDDLEDLDYDEIDLCELTEEAYSGGAAVTGWKSFWNNGIGGAMPILSNAGSTTHSVRIDNCLEALNSNRSAWFFVHVPVSSVNTKAECPADLWRGSNPPVSSINKYYYDKLYPGYFDLQTPAYYGWDPMTAYDSVITADDRLHWFMSASMWGLSLEVELG